MEVKVDYGKIYDIGTNVIKENDDLLTNLNDIMKIIDEIGECWQGTDYNNFKNNSITYISKQEEMLKQLEFMGKYMTFASGVYTDYNETWGEKMKRMGDDYNGREKHYD